MRPKPPCREPGGPDCPNRSVGCQAHCEKYQAFRAECDSIIAERRKSFDFFDYNSRRIYQKRVTLLLTEKGRRALTQR